MNGLFLHENRFLSRLVPSIMLSFKCLLVFSLFSFFFITRSLPFDFFCLDVWYSHVLSESFLTRKSLMKPCGIWVTPGLLSLPFTHFSTSLTLSSGSNHPRYCYAMVTVRISFFPINFCALFGTQNVRSFLAFLSACAYYFFRKPQFHPQITMVALQIRYNRPNSCSALVLFPPSDQLASIYLTDVNPCHSLSFIYLSSSN